MNVEVKLFATFRQDRFKKDTMTVPDGVAIEAIIDELSIPKDELGILLVNGHYATIDKTLTADEVVSIFPSVGGG